MWNTLDGTPPVIIAHRGASGYRPEHTLEAYALAIEQGADVIEPDLVFTKDGVLVARHDRYISTTTNVIDHPEFADRKRPDPNPDLHGGEQQNDWWIEDFTLAELKTLRARQPFPGRSTEFDDQFDIATFEEVLALITQISKTTDRTIGVYPETKHPGFFESIGLDFEKPLLAALEGFDAGPVFIQSFEADILKRLKGKTNATLVQLLLEDADGTGPNIPLADVAGYADAVGPPKSLLITTKGDDSYTASSFIKDAHALNLKVHPWTFRKDQPNPALQPPTRTFRVETAGDDLIFVNPASLESEYKIYFQIGVDGLFTDFPDTAIETRNTMNMGGNYTP